jgi:hypothetical protein
LRHQPERASTVLQELSKLGGIVGLDAKMVLKEWKKGNL